jgi:hypothetical protein
MTLLQRITREPTLILGLVTATIALVVAFGIDLTKEQTGAIFGFVAALILLLRWLVTPAAEVVVQQKPGDPAPIAGPAAIVTTGAPVSVALEQIPPPDPNKVDDLE